MLIVHHLLLCFTFNYRYAMAYEKYNPINTEIGFLALDPDRVFEQDDAKFTDLGEDVDLSFKTSEVSHEKLSFLNSVM